MLNLDATKNVTHREHLEHNHRIHNLEADNQELFATQREQNKWILAESGDAKEPNDIEFLEYHYHRLIRKYDVPFENLKHVKDICLRYLDREKAEEERKRLAHQLEVYEGEVQRHSKIIRLDEQWLAEGGESIER